MAHPDSCSFYETGFPASGFCVCQVTLIFVCLLFYLSNLFDFYLMSVGKIKTQFSNSENDCGGNATERGVCVCVSDEGHVNYLSTDVPCHCQTETFTLLTKLLCVMFHSQSQTPTTQHTG